jgi:hypothetical protein
VKIATNRISRHSPAGPCEQLKRIVFGVIAARRDLLGPESGFVSRNGANRLS